MAAVRHGVTAVLSEEFGWVQISGVAVWDPWQHAPRAHGSETTAPIYLGEAILMPRP